MRWICGERKSQEEDDAANQLTYQLERTEFRDKIAVFSAKDPNTETVSLSQETEEIADQHNLKLDSLLTPQLSEASIADSTSGYVERTVSDVERQAVTLVNMTSPATNRRSLRDSDWIKERSAVLLEDDAASRSRSGQVHAEEQPRESTTKGAGSSPPFSASQATEKQLLSPSRRVNESIPTEIIDHVQVESYPAPVSTDAPAPPLRHSTHFISPPAIPKPHSRDMLHVQTGEHIRISSHHHPLPQLRSTARPPSCLRNQDQQTQKVSREARRSHLPPSQRLWNAGEYTSSGNRTPADDLRIPLPSPGDHRRQSLRTSQQPITQSLPIKK